MTHRFNSYSQKIDKTVKTVYPKSTTDQSSNFSTLDVLKRFQRGERFDMASDAEFDNSIYPEALNNVSEVDTEVPVFRKSGADLTEFHNVLKNGEATLKALMKSKKTAKTDLKQGNQPTTATEGSGTGTHVPSEVADATEPNA